MDDSKKDVIDNPAKNGGDYTQEDQAGIIGQAVVLTSTIEVEEEEIQRLRSEKFKSPPELPKRQVLSLPKVNVTIPPPPTGLYNFSDYLCFKDKKNILLRIIAIAGFVIIPFGFLILCVKPELVSDHIFFSSYLVYSLFGIVIFPIIIAVDYGNIKRQLNLEAMQSPEYLARVEIAKNEAKAAQERLARETEVKQKLIDYEYKLQTEQFNNVILPQYNKELAEWKQTQAKKIKALEDDLNVNRDTLTNLYETTKIIPVAYRELWMLRWIYEDMKSSTDDVSRAMDLLDRERQRAVTREAGDKAAERLKELQVSVKEQMNGLRVEMSQGFYGLYDAVEEGNEELARIRRRASVGNAIGIVGAFQRHKIIKNLK